MKKVLLALLVVVSAGISSSASNNSTDPSNSSSPVITSKSISVIENSTKIVLQQKVNTICKLIQLGEIDAVKNLHVFIVHVINPNRKVRGKWN